MNKNEEVEIPLKHRYLTRQLDLIPMEVLNEQITIIGAGAVGSFTALALTKMGFENITVYDFDKLEEANMNCQFYRTKDIGKPKVQALQELIEDFTGVKINIKNQKYEGGTFNGIVISAVDNMTVRKLIWEEHKEVALNTKIIIDPRMGAQQALCYAIKPLNQKDIDAYEKTLYSDEDAVQERCTAKATMFTVLALSSHVAKIIKDFLCSEDKKYSRIMEWNLEKNVQQCFSSK